MARLDTLGRPLRDLRISVTDRCNFRCPYCMPAETYGASYQFLRRDQILTFEEIVRLAGLFGEMGARKIRLTGGEPLLREDLPFLIRMLAALESIEDLTLTSNGQRLAPFALTLKEAGLSRVTVSLDSLDEEIFARLSGREHRPEDVLSGIAAAERAGLTPIKINVVILRDVNESSILEIARRFRGTGHIVRFIEYMDVGNLNGWKMEHVVPAREILERLDGAFPLEPIEPAYPGEVARRYRYRDGSGEIGVIASVTRPFCGDCTRARLSTDGRLYTCLFASDGLDLKGPLRAGARDADLRELIDSGWRRRTDRYSEERAAGTRPVPGKVEMYQIGG